MAEITEKVLMETSGLQRFEKPVPPVFIFGSYLGSLLLTNERLLFLSAGSSGADRVFAGAMLGIFTPESLRTVQATLGNPGSLDLPHARLLACSGHRRWDFGRYLRIEYADEGGKQHATSFIFRGPVLGSGWIESWVASVAPFLEHPSSQSPP